MVQTMYIYIYITHLSLMPFDAITSFFKMDLQGKQHFLYMLRQMPNQSYNTSGISLDFRDFLPPPDPKPPPSNRKGVWRETSVSWHNAHVHGCLGHRDTWQTTPRCRCIPELTFWSLLKAFFFGSPSQAASVFIEEKNPPSEHTMLLAGTWWSQYSKHLQKPRPEMEHNPT